MRVGERRVQRAYLSSWACLTGAGGVRYVQLAYGCAIVPDQDSVCAGGDEWFPVLDDHGRVLDTGIPNGGAPSPALRARERLEPRLGLAQISDKGLSLQSVTDAP